MCGITGLAAVDGPGPAPDQLEAMNRVLAHRGPDDARVDIRGPVGLAMSRLAIIDLETGRQPLTNEDGSVRSVFNGEIYNFRQLRAELEARGHRFSTHSDGEVIVHLWEELGSNFATKLNGMFAIAIHDESSGTLALVRDRVGIKPLFWTWQRDRLIFGSEIKAILASGELRPELDLDGLGQFMAWEYVPAPKTMFKDIFKLEPGCILLLNLDSGEMIQRRWWNLLEIVGADTDGLSELTPRSPRERAADLDRHVSQAVERQLVSDVPLGAFLSGGVDSSLVVSSMGSARAFSIGFDDPSYDERPWATEVARHLGLDHRQEIIRPIATELFDRLMVFLDDPIGDFSILPTYLLSKLAREEVKVALSGDGGDELFGGYETYVAQNMARGLDWAPDWIRRGLLPQLLSRVRPRPAKKGVINKAKRFVEGLSHEPSLAHARWRLFLGTQARNRLFTPEALRMMELPVSHHIDRLRREAAELPAMNRDLYVDFKSYLVDNCLVKVDRMSMACSLEVRVPLLDHELVEFAFRLPPALKVRGATTKVLMKSVAARHIPRRCVYRPKEGFSIPIKEWLMTELRSRMEDLLADRHLSSQGLFQVDEVRRLKSEHLAGQANHSHVLWCLMVYQDWARRWSVCEVIKRDHASAAATTFDVVVVGGGVYGHRGLPRSSAPWTGYCADRAR